MFQTDLPSSFWWLMAGYAALLVGVGLTFTRRVKSSSDLFQGAGRSGPVFSGLSYFMTAFSASIFVANASLAYRHGSLNALLILAQLPVFVAGYLVFAARWHRSGCQTAVEFIEQRFGRTAARFYTGLGVPMRILDNANRVYVTAVLCEAVLGVNLFVGALVTFAIALLSAIGGGFVAIVVTDAVQAVLLTLIVTVVAILSWDRVGGWSEFVAQVPDQYWSLEGSGGFGLSTIVVWSFVGLFAWNGSWSLVQRFVAVPTERDARRVSLVSGISYYLLFPIIAIPCMAAVLLVPGLDTPQKAEFAYILTAQQVLPIGLMAMLCFGLLSATVTALNSELNVIAQVLVHDLWKRRLARYSDATRLWLGRVVMVVAGLACLALALRIRELGGAFKFLITVHGMTTLPTYVPLLLALLWPGATARGAIAASLAGIVASLVFQFGLQWDLAAVIAGNGIVTSLVFWLSGRWPERDPERRRRVDELFHRLAHPAAPAPLAPRDRAHGVAAARVAAVALSLAGLLAVVAHFLDEPDRRGGAALGIAAALFVVAALIFLRHRPSRP